MTGARLRLEHLATRLGARDWDILEMIAAHRFLTTRQLARLFFGMTPDGRVIPRPANHAVTRLNGLGLLNHLERRIGGVRAGSGGYVWTITDLTHRLLAQRTGIPAVDRIREFEPSPAFLEHTLAVAEVVITLTEAARWRDVALSRVELEPQCWRPYLGLGGATVRLKPDLAVVTVTGGFEDHWFFEIDRATEPPSRIVRKCLQYQEYRHTGIEQERSGIFPAVGWIVPSETRRNQISQRLALEPHVTEKLFTVITPDELSRLIGLGVEKFTIETRRAAQDHAS